MYTLHIMKGRKMDNLIFALCIYAFPVSVWVTSFGISQLIVKGK